MLIESKDYVRKENAIPAIQWDGNLETVPSVTQWILQYDPSAIVSANFSSEGMYLRVQTSGVVLGVYPKSYIAILGGKVVSFNEEAFLDNYQEAKEDIPFPEIPKEDPAPEAPDEVV